MSRTLRACLRLLLVIAVTVAALGEIPVSAADARVVAGSLVNVRACARLDCAVIGNAELGATLNVTGSVQNGFLPVAWQGGMGYIYANFLDRGNDDPWFREGDVSCNRVALIFNIGIPYTPSQTVLNTLIQKNAAATMFPMGWWAKVHPDYLRQLDAAGFPIGTHGDQRIELTTMSDAAVRKDMLDSKAAIEAVIGHPIIDYMTPYASSTALRDRRIVADLGMLPVGWNVSAADYDQTATEQYVYSRVMNGVYPGAIIEFHLDGPATETSTARALPRIIDALRAQGYTLSTVPDLIKACSPPVMPGWPTNATVTGTGGDGLLCRANPSSGGAILGQFSEGQRITLRGRAFNGWYPVLCGSQKAWSSAQYLQASPVTTPSPTQTSTTTTTPAPTRSPTTTPTAQTATVTGTGGGGLNCRTGAGTNYGIITTLAEGGRVTVRGATSNGWVPIVCANQNGWASAQYLRIASSNTPTPMATATSTPTTTYARVSNTGGDGVNCRTGAGTGYAVITVAQEGSRLPLRGSTNNGWVPVTCDGRVGWISAAYLTIPG